MTIGPGSRIGPYEVTAHLGEGGTGVVFRARDSRLQRDVALKLLPEHFANDPDRLPRFEREAQVLASLNHPGIAQIYGLEQVNGSTCMVMEMVDGETLEDGVIWSPDSRRLATLADGTLRIFDLASGSSRPLGSVGALRGGSWNREGMLIMARASDNIIVRMSDSGGDVTPDQTRCRPQGDPPRDTRIPP